MQSKHSNTVTKPLNIVAKIVDRLKKRGLHKADLDSHFGGTVTPTFLAQQLEEYLSDDKHITLQKKEGGTRTLQQSEAPSKIADWLACKVYGLKTLKQLEKRHPIARGKARKSIKDSLLQKFLAETTQEDLEF